MLRYRTEKRRTMSNTSLCEMYAAEKKKRKKKKRKRKNEEDEDDDNDERSDDDSDGDTVLRRGCSIFFASEVSPKSIAKLRKHLDEATKLALNSSNTIDAPKIALYIDSPGGDAFSGFSAASLVRRNPVEVCCIVDGHVASSATFILLAAKKRYIVPGSHVLIHSLSNEMSGTFSFSELKDDVSNCSRITANMKHIYETSTTLSEKKIKKLMKRELDLDTRQCLKYGIVHDMLK